MAYPRSPWARLIGDPKCKLLSKLGWRVALPDIARVSGNYVPRNLRGMGSKFVGHDRALLQLWREEWLKFQTHVEDWEGYRRTLRWDFGVIRDDWGEVESAWPWSPAPDIKAVAHRLLGGDGGRLARGTALDSLLFWITGTGGSVEGARLGVHHLVTRTNHFCIWALGPGLVPGLLSPGDAAVVLRIWNGESLHPNESRQLRRSAWYKAAVGGSLSTVPGAQVGSFHRRWAAWDSMAEKSWWICGGPWNGRLSARRSEWESVPGRGTLLTWKETTGTELPAQPWQSWTEIGKLDTSLVGSPPPWLRERQLSPRSSPRQLSKHWLKRLNSGRRTSSGST